MKLYLTAKSKKNISYTPEYIHITLTTGSKVTLDIRGEITYSYLVNGLNCSVKGELIPRAITDVNGGRNVLHNLTDKLIKDWFSEALVCNSFNHATEIIIEAYSAPENFDFKDDELTDGRGTIEYVCNNETVVKGFTFKTKIID